MNILTAAQKEQFEESGYLLFEDLFDPMEDLQPILNEYEAVLDDLAQKLKEEGIIASTHRGKNFSERVINLSLESGRNLGQHFDFSLPQSGITEDTPIHTGPAVFQMLTNPKMLDFVEDLIGQEIYSNPVQHVRMKLPPRAVSKNSTSYLTSRVPWHQDLGVIMPEADEATILTVWFPLTEATIENGCLQVVPGSHRAGLVPHCPSSSGIGIPDALVAESKAKPMPMRPGSVLAMTQRTVHGSLDNVSESDVRISMDLRYQPIGQPCGRPAFAPAGFVARSAAHPETELRDPAVWAQNWQTVKRSLIGEDSKFNRWKKGANGCA